MKHAYAPYSGFHVGAALLATDGTIYCGANIENASYGATNCAERTALFTAVYAGCRDFSALAVTCSGDHVPYPCGICLQALSEFCPGSMTVIMQSQDGITETMSLSELLPHAFTKEELDTTI